MKLFFHCRPALSRLWELCYQAQRERISWKQAVRLLTHLILKYDSVLKILPSDRTQQHWLMTDVFMNILLWIKKFGTEQIDLTFHPLSIFNAYYCIIVCITFTDDAQFYLRGSPGSTCTLNYIFDCLDDVRCWMAKTFYNSMKEKQKLFYSVVLVFLYLSNCN